MSQKLTDEQKRKLFNGQLAPPYRLAKLHDYNGDLSKRWAVEFWVWNQNLNNGKGGLHRKQKKFTTKLSADERRRQAQEFIFDINEALILGYHIQSTKTSDNKEAAIYAKETISATDGIDVILKIIKVQLKSSSYKDYKLECDKLKNYIEEKYPGLLLQDLDTQIALEFLDFEQVEKNLSNTTRNNKLSAFKSVFESLKTRAFINENPFSNIKKAQQKKSQKHAFRKYHKDILLPYLREKDPQLYYVCMFEYYLFLRPGEIQTLKISQIQWEEKRVVINNDSKTGRPRFPVISEACEKVILEMGVLGLNPDFYVFGKSRKPGPVCTGHNTFRRRFMEIRDKLGIESKYSLYSWKHTGNLDSLMAGVNIKAIQQQNGHTDIATTDAYLQSLGFEHNEQIRSKQPSID
ncbi:tyrosine-type recombinase/integrase [Roseivirga seohaensis]|uniref:tyrosine-type recombinase/integrase n=1 Tax=Roseivirga seohaensis TaxID=1914963 RepID=UPI003BA9F5FD